MNASGAYASQPVSEAIGIHSRRRTHGLEITVVFEEEFLRFAAEGQRSADPLLQSSCDHCAPEFFFGCSFVVNWKHRALKHGLSPPEWTFLPTAECPLDCRWYATNRAKSEGSERCGKTTRNSAWIVGNTLVLSRVRSYLFGHPYVRMTSFGAVEGPVHCANAQLGAEFFPLW